MFLKEKEINSRNAGFFAQAAATDARVKNLENKKYYTASEIRDIESAKTTLEYLAYHGDFYVNFRKKFAVVKIDNARVKSKKVVADLDEYYASRGWQKVRARNTKTVLYRMPRTSK